MNEVKKAKRWGRQTRFTDADEGKEILLRVAIECLVRRGIKRTTVDNVATAANVSRRTVYRYFDHKEHMLKEVFDYGRKLVFDELKARAQPFENDFPRFFEECVVGAVKYYETISEIGGGKDLVSRNNLNEAERYINDVDTRESWRRLMFQPYSNYIAALELPREERTLDEFIDLAHMLVVGHRHLFSSEQTVRKSVQSLRIGLPMRNTVAAKA